MPRASHAATAPDTITTDVLDQRSLDLMFLTDLFQHRETSNVP